MATSTPNYGLHQWAPWENLRRETFNQNHSDIDAALKGVENRLAAVGHDLYGALLQSHYDGKVTDWKRSLFFDGLRDKSLVAQASDCLAFTGKEVGLCRTSQGNINLGYAASADFQAGDRTAGPCTAQGYATLTGLIFKTQKENANMEQFTVQYHVQVNGQSVRSGQKKCVFDMRPTENTLTFSGVLLEPGDQFSVQIFVGNTAYLLFSASGGTMNLGGTLLLTPTCGTAGSIITPALSLPERTSLRAWARFRGGTVSLATKAGGEVLNFAVLGDRATVNAAGEVCTEREFTLKEVPESGSLAFHLDLELSQSNQMELFDYGILLL